MDISAQMVICKNCGKIVQVDKVSCKKIAAPMVSTFYRAPAPNAEPFVEVGTEVESGQTICILEAMKMMNEITAEEKGVIMKILIEDGAIVEYGEVLMLYSNQYHDCGGMVGKIASIVPDCPILGGTSSHVTNLTDVKLAAATSGQILAFDLGKDIGIVWGKKPNEFYWFTSVDCSGDTFDIKDGDEIHFSRIIGGGKRVTNVIKKDGELTNVAASKTKIDANKERRKLAQMFAYGEITKEIFEQRLKQLDGESTTSTIAGQDTARQKYINGEITKEQYENLKES